MTQIFILKFNSKFALVKQSTQISHGLLHKIFSPYITKLFVVKIKYLKFLFYILFIFFSIFINALSLEMCVLAFIEPEEFIEHTDGEWDVPVYLFYFFLLL